MHNASIIPDHQIARIVPAEADFVLVLRGPGKQIRKSLL